MTTLRTLGVVLALAGAGTLATAHGAPRAASKKKLDEVAPQATALNGADVEAAAKAATALGAMTDPAAHEALLDGLALGLPPAVAVPALAALAQRPAPPDIASLRRYAGDHDPTVRSAAIAVLALYPDPAAHAAVVAARHDPVDTVRAAAANAAAQGRIRESVEPLLALLALGEEPAARALAALADVELARVIGEHLGQVPDATLALCLGLILKRPDFGPDTARVQVVRAIGKIQGTEAITALTDYVDATPKNPPRPSRHEAESIVEARLGGGNP
jgi:HEAT repeat protein